AVVAAQPSDFFDEIHLDRHVLPPRGRRHAQMIIRELDVEPNASEKHLDLARRDGCSKERRDAHGTNDDALAPRGLRRWSGEVDRCAGDGSARKQHDDLSDALERLGSNLDVHPSLETIARVGRETERTARGTDAPRIEVRDLEENVRRRVGDFALAATHY